MSGIYVVQGHIRCIFTTAFFRKTYWSINNFSSYHSVLHCPALYSPVNGELSCTSSFSYGSTCSFSCEEGFLLQGASEISCTKMAKWSQEPPHCEGNNQTLVSFTDLQVDLTYCILKFVIKSHWILSYKTLSFFNSVAVVCPQLLEPINGHMNCSSEEPSFGTVCTFSCLDGHQLISNEIMTCNLNGSWSGEVAVCQGK